jgi:hypothetical protein
LDQVRQGQLGLNQKGGSMNLNSILIGSENPQGLRDYYNKIYQPGGAPEMWIATFSDPDNNYFQLMSSI